MRHPKPLLATALLTASAVVFSTSTEKAQAQGCVAVRGGGMCPLALHDGLTPDDAHLQDGDWVADVSYRWLHSHRHFVGDEEQKQRQAAGNQVINQQHFIDAGIQYAITPRYSVGLTLPFSISDRSQTYTPPGGSLTRYSTTSSGIGDIRITGYAWIWEPTQQLKGNVQVGLGLTAPTGQDDVMGSFPTVTGGKVVWAQHPVDQSIQLGDGGWGVAAELNAYREILPRTSLYFQGFYLINPEDQNGVATARNLNIPKGATVRNSFEDTMSIADQYLARGGVGVVLVPSWGLSVSLGGRVEGVPVHDLIGDNDGFRRPGFAVAIEPGIEVMKGRYSFGLSVPFAMYRNRQLSEADYRYSNTPGGVPGTHGDAAFADYVVTANFSVRF